MKKLVKDLLRELWSINQNFGECATGTLIEDHASAQLAIETHHRDTKAHFLSMDSKLSHDKAYNLLERFVVEIESVDVRDSYYAIIKELQPTLAKAFSIFAGALTLNLSTDKGLSINFYVDCDDKIVEYSIFFPKNLIPDLYREVCEDMEDGKHQPH